AGYGHSICVARMRAATSGDHPIALDRAAAPARQAILRPDRGAEGRQRPRQHLVGRRDGPQAPAEIIDLADPRGVPLDDPEIRGLRGTGDKERPHGAQQQKTEMLHWTPPEQHHVTPHSRHKIVCRVTKAMQDVRKRAVNNSATRRASLTASQRSVSFTSVSGRSLPAAVSVCHWPFSSSYSMTWVCPGTRCSRAARLAAVSAAACVRNGSENTSPTL